MFWIVIKHQALLGLGEGPRVLAWQDLDAVNFVRNVCSSAINSII